MTTKGVLVEQILLLLGRADPSFRIDEREVELLVGQVRDELLVADYFQRLANDIREIPAEWLTPFEGTALHDERRKRDYLLLPYAPLRLPGDVGFFSLAPLADEFNTFVPVRPGDLALLSAHPAFRTEGRVAYWREGLTVWFRDPVRALGPVLGQVVAPSSVLGLDEPFALPGDKEPALIDAVRARLASKPAPDLVPDNRDQA